MPKATKSTTTTSGGTKSKPKTKSPPQPSPSSTSTISWPLIPSRSPHHPLPPLTTLLPSQIYVLPSLFPTSLSNIYLSFLNKHIAPLLTTTPSRPKRGEAVRVNDRFQVRDEEFAEMLWNKSGLREVVLESADEKGRGVDWGGEVVGLNPNIRIYRYLKGMFFDKHYDDSNTLTLSDPQITCYTTYTLLIYLTSSPPIIGGQTVFYPNPDNTDGAIEVSPQQGTALLHAHGSKCLLHEGKEVTDDGGGVGKWILRSDLVVKT